MPGARAPFAETILELSLAAVLIAIPLFVVPYSALPFEETKVALLRSMALLCLPFLLLVLARIHHDPSRLTIPDSKQLIAIAAVVLLFGYIHLVSAFYGPSPNDSFFGNQIRRQGTYTTFCYLFFFCAVITTIRTHEQMDRLLLAIQLAGFVVSFWALAQYLGIDPNLFHGFAKPTWSTFGNRLFLPAFLIMCIPINLYFVNRSFMALQSFKKTNRPENIQKRLKVFISICLLFLALNLFAIVMAQKRGPLLGLTVALFLFLLLYLLGRGRRKLACGLLCGFSLLAFPLVFIALAGHRLTLPFHLPFLQSLADSFQTGTGLVRVYIWKGIISLLASHPGRLLTGHGAETVSLATPLHMPPILKQLEGPTDIADRAHNEIFDLIVMHGVLGTAAFLTIFGMLGYLVLRHLGLIQAKHHKAAWPICLLSGLLLGSWLSYFATREIAFCGMGMGLGMLGGFFMYLLYFMAMTPKRYRTRWDATAMLLSLLLASLVAHFVEIQFSFGITATRLYFWVLSGMVVVAGCFWKTGTNTVLDSGRNAQFQLPPATYAATLGCVASIATSFAYLCFSSRYNAYIYSITTCQISITAVCFFLFQPHVDPVSRLHPRLRSQDALTILAVLGVGILYALIFFIAEPAVATVMKWFPDAAPATVIAKNVKLSITYAGIFIIILLGALFWLRQQGVHIPNQWQNMGFYLFLIVLMIPLVVRSNLYYAMADIYTKAGGELIRSDNWESAHRCYRAAIALEDRQAWHYQKLGNYFFKRAKMVLEPQKSRLYQEAIRQTEKSTQLAPHDVTLKNNLARMSLVWSADTRDEKDRFHRLKLTQTFYDRALISDPNNALIWKESGQLSASLGQRAKAVKQFERALQLKPNDYESHRNLALLHQAQNRFEVALGHARTALTLATNQDIFEIQALILKIQSQIK